MNSRNTVNMGKISFRLLPTALVLVLMAVSGRAQADSNREFIMSCTYGVLAGTLVGAASLAFSEEPGENLQQIARGASIGLYAGILLGLYVVYVVPAQMERMQQQQLENSIHGHEFKLREPRFAVYPLINDQTSQVDGAGASVHLMSF